MQVLSERKDIDCIQNTILVNGESLRAITKVRSWNKLHKVYTHIYYNAKKALLQSESLYGHIADLRDKAKNDPAKFINDALFTKYLIIQKSEMADFEYTVNIRENVIENELLTAGWLVIISNYVEDAKKALQIYRVKDVVEKGFLLFKTNLELDRLRVHSQVTMQNKVFIGFVALVMLSAIHKVMSDENMYKKMTLKQLLLTLSKLRLQEINGERIIYPATKEQKAIFKAFRVEDPV